MALDVGDRLIEQGKPSEDIFFIEEGRAAVVLEDKIHGPIRLATVGRGAMIGEMAFYLHKPRSASVIVEEPLLAWRFSTASLNELATASPEVAIAFHRGMASILADRLASANAIVKLLSD